MRGVDYIIAQLPRAALECERLRCEHVRIADRREGGVERATASLKAWQRAEDRLKSFVHSVRARRLEDAFPASGYAGEFEACFEAEGVATRRSRSFDAGYNGITKIVSERQARHERRQAAQVTKYHVNGIRWRREPWLNVHKNLVRFTHSDFF